MKMIKIIAASALALSPVLVAAESVTSGDQAASQTVTPGGISQTGTEGLPVLGTIPTGAIVVGGVVILAGVAIGVVAASDSGSDSVAVSTSTN